MVLFDPDTVRDRGTYTDPRRHPDGIGLVMVNGEIVYGSAGVLGEEFCAEKPAGMVIRL
jgi:N-acyl-D-aspartate/D-glutamate deacylase